MSSPQVTLEGELLDRVLTGELTREEAVAMKLGAAPASWQQGQKSPAERVRENLAEVSAPHRRQRERRNRADQDAELAPTTPTSTSRDLVAGKRGKLTAAELRQVLDLAIEETGLEPVYELLRMVRAGEVTMDQKIKILSEINSYRMPKLKAVEYKGEMDLNITVQVKQYDTNVQSQDSGKESILIEAEEVADGSN
jgi:hypothetical protein